MSTLAQMRAARAIKDAATIEPGQKGGDSISGFPALIRTDGLMAALAYSVETKESGNFKHKGAQSIAKSIAGHLKDLGIVEQDDPLALAKELAEDTAGNLRRATAESLAYLSYLKRFVQ